MSQPDESIRLYLMFLEDPAKLRDEVEIKKLQGNVEKAKDPIDRLLAIAALERAQNVDGAEYRDGFIRDAKAWADEHSVTASAFVQMGVPTDDLAAAGFEVRGGRRGAGAAGSSARSRSRRVSAETIRDAILSTSEPFTLADVQERTGASLGTVRKVVAGLVESGELGDLGPDPEHDGRGRAPNRYQKA